jgi:hypothetical protein
MKEHDKGYFRSVYSILWDDPDFRKLSSDAKLVFVCLKTCRLNNIAGVFSFGKGGQYTISELTGLSFERVTRALDTLSRGDWASYADGILWIRNSLKFDPFIDVANENHQKAIEDVLKTLPRSPLIANFRKYYNLNSIIVSPTDTLPDSPTDSPPPPPSIPIPDQRAEAEAVSEPRKETESESLNTDEEAGNRASPAAASPAIGFVDFVSVNGETYKIINLKISKVHYSKLKSMFQGINHEYELMMADMKRPNYPGKGKKPNDQAYLTNWFCRTHKTKKEEIDGGSSSDFEDNGEGNREDCNHSKYDKF